MVFAILGAAWNTENPSRAWELCGSGFFLSPTVALTCNHVLTALKCVLAPEPYEMATYWLVLRDGRSHKVAISSIDEFPDVETTVLSFEEPPFGLVGFGVSKLAVQPGDRVSALGHSYGVRGTSRPRVSFGLRDCDLEVEHVDLAPTVDDRQGRLLSRGPISVNGEDVRLVDVPCLRLGFNTVVGMSGGPILNLADGQVCGLNAWGFPAYAEVKTEAYAFEIAEVLTRTGLRF